MGVGFPRDALGGSCSGRRTSCSPLLRPRRRDGGDGGDGRGAAGPARAGGAAGPARADRGGGCGGGGRGARAPDVPSLRTPRLLAPRTPRNEETLLAAEPRGNLCASHGECAVPARPGVSERLLGDPERPRCTARRRAGRVGRRVLHLPRHSRRVRDDAVRPQFPRGVPRALLQNLALAWAARALPALPRLSPHPRPCRGALHKQPPDRGRRRSRSGWPVRRRDNALAERASPRLHLLPWATNPTFRRRAHATPRHPMPPPHATPRHPTTPPHATPPRHPTPPHPTPPHATPPRHPTTPLHATARHRTPPHPHLHRT
jgi:hypothetical protein